MSDSELESRSSASAPSDEKLEKGLRKIVAEIFRTGNTEQLTVKRVRSATEQALGLDEGFFKNDPDWKSKSDRIIKEEAEAQEQSTEQAKKEPSSPLPKSAKGQQQKSKSTKRASADTSEPTKKRRKKEPSPDLLDRSSKSSLSDDEKDVAKRNTGKSQVASNITKRDSSGDDVTDQPPLGQPDEAAGDDAASESEMSVLIDEEDKSKPKQQRQKKASPAQDKKKQKSDAKKGSKTANLDPDQAEIKRLQGWLMKCGIRKMWHRELAPYDTPKAKIKHLKQMLKDAGMEGRYSLEKANRIREERELRADLEGVQEGAKLWGTGTRTRSGEKNTGASEEQPRPRVARGLKNFDFLVGEDEESD